jgi:CDP-glycerol glycerophosphotransferase (TagB/SpsB family)
LEDRLLSDYFCVSGFQSKSLKEKFLKDTKEIVITGQPRFDSLARADKFFNRNGICRKFGLISDKKILLWATDSGLSVEESKENISTVYDAAKAVENAQLVIKLHPAEDQEAPLYKQNHHYAPVIIGGKQAISELLYVCDVMITKASTTALEAAILNRPIIVLNLSGEPDPMPYVEKSVALGVYKKEDLVPTIRKILYDEKIREKLAKQREKFVYEYAYIQDGKASERVANLILDLIEKPG